MPMDPPITNLRLLIYTVIGVTLARPVSAWLQGERLFSWGGSSEETYPDSTIRQVLHLEGKAAKSMTLGKLARYLRNFSLNINLITFLLVPMEVYGANWLNRRKIDVASEYAFGGIWSELAESKKD
uniref:Uncharacterized protein n=1 Tax=Quercus lobata TaxID=97700 RepID=A0A7N2M0S2_QUELO